MANGFAGAGRLDERRRRRLASEDGSNAVPEVPEQEVQRSSVPAGTRRPLPQRQLPTELPLQFVVPRPIWMHALLGVAILAVTVLLSLKMAQARADASEVARLLFDAQSGSALRGLFAIEMLAASMFLAIVGWARSLSLTDFDGRFVTWLRAAGCAFATGIVFACGLDQALLSVLVDVWGEAAARLVPAGLSLVIGSELLWSLYRDSRGSRATGILCLGLALASGTAAVGCAIDVLADVSATTLTMSAMLVGSGFTFLIAIWHARYVVYVSVEPLAAKRRPARKKNEAKLDPTGTAQLQQPPTDPTQSKSQTPAEVADGEEAFKVVGNDSPEQQATTTQTEMNTETGSLKAPRAARKKIKPERRKAVSSAAPAPEPVEQAPPTMEIDGKTLRLDLPEQQLLKGLSKRDRRLVRKRLRELERQASVPPSDRRAA
ncbi:hypothetical protein [Stratiformator vulcanicus]|uniref:Uncharacterized protein n=1 Tax=Stratiformator vulcanicus TaxID=2527980 RepID=A0A517QYP5_9PLAN|nr:hypothetical protein [Stratiformator vulcanicus]QDT36724.1 hypothetical protein Pan189_10870 [Stratiformator vulcanicus]